MPIAKLEMLDPDLIVSVSILYLVLAGIVLVAGRLGRLDFRPAKWRLLGTAIVFTGALAAPYFASLTEVRSRPDRKEEIEAFFGAAQGLAFLFGMLLTIWAACGVRRDPPPEPEASEEPR